MIYQDIPKEELQVLIEKIVGTALIVFRGFTYDSNGDKIIHANFYKIEKHLPSGSIIVMPTGKDAKKEFFNDVMNKQMAKTGKLN